jgi:uncharacterized protein
MKRIEILGEGFQLFPDRAAFRESNKTLLVADLHWGKAETFQKSGVAVSSTVLDDDLRRLSSLIDMTGAERVWVLGDLIHSPSSLTPNVIETVTQWRKRHATVEFVLIRGNHDRRTVFPEEWDLRDAGPVIVDDPFMFVHDEPRETGGAFVFLGHVHPVIDLSSTVDRVRLPCFLVEKDRALLPAFSAFTGGHPIDRPRAGDRVFAIADGTLVEI